MASNRMLLGLGQLLRVVRKRSESANDSQLLEQFCSMQDEAAFATLVQRHGPMVLGVCRRILDNLADAEDAFQATFLVLVRKAASLRGSSFLGGFLHGVARRTALKARDARIRRRPKEQAMARSEAQDEARRDDWLPLLDEEVARLPEKYRLPVVLCDLQGKTRQEAAEQMGWPEGTVAGRLARAREMLARRLSRHGREVTAGSLAAVLAQQSTACVPPALRESTLKAASVLAAGQVGPGIIATPVFELTEGVVRAMAMTQFKTILLTTTLAVLGTAALGFGALGGKVASSKIEGADVPLVRAEGQPNEAEKGKEDVAGKEDPPPAPDRPPERPVLYPPDYLFGPLSEKLERPFDFGGMDDPKMTLSEALDQLEKRYSVPFVINQKAFVSENLVDVAKHEVANPNPLPSKRNTTLGQVLNMVLERIPSESGAMFVIRGNHVECTTRAAVRAEVGRQEDEPLPPLVYAGIDKQPLEKVLQALAQRTGSNLVLDLRVGDKAKTLVSAEFKNVPLDSVVRVLTDMCDLRPVQMGNMTYITSPENAERLQKEQSK